MEILVVGATGMTGSRLVQQLLGRNHRVRAIVRSPDKLLDLVSQHPNLEVTEATLLDMDDAELGAQVMSCHAVVSCLGHNLNFDGMFGNPRKLCTLATQRLCHAIEANKPARATKFVLMNTVGVHNPDLGERRTWFENALLGTLRYTVPPHSDNETAASYLHSVVGNKNGSIEWCIVRPDSLINAEHSQYDIEESPTTGIFSGRPTARSNVAHFMAELIENESLWSDWKFRMPVIMNSRDS